MMYVWPCRLHTGQAATHTRYPACEPSGHRAPLLVAGDTDAARCDALTVTLHVNALSGLVTPHCPPSKSQSKQTQRGARQTRDGENVTPGSKVSCTEMRPGYMTADDDTMNTLTKSLVKTNTACSPSRSVPSGRTESSV